MTSKVVHLDPTSVEAWRERRTKTIELEGDVAVKIRLRDLLALLDGDGNIPNPLLEIVQGNTTGDSQDAGRALMSDPAKLAGLRKALNDILIDVVVSPPLVDQGHEDGISVDDFTLEEKMHIFMELAGGEERLTAATRFPEGQAAGVDDPPNGQNVSARSKRSVVAE